MFVPATEIVAAERNARSVSELLISGAHVRCVPDGACRMAHWLVRAAIILSGPQC